MDRADSASINRIHLAFVISYTNNRISYLILFLSLLSRIKKKEGKLLGSFEPPRKETIDGKVVKQSCFDMYATVYNFIQIDREVIVVGNYRRGYRGYVNDSIRNF